MNDIMNEMKRVTDVPADKKPARFTTPERHKKWIAPLEKMTARDMPHDLFCFATRYLVEEARAIGLPDQTLVRDLPDWLTIDYLMNTGKQVSHGVFIALAERLKEARKDPSPYKLRTAAYHAAEFEDWVTNMVRRGGSVGFAMWFTSFMGNLVTRDQRVEAGETARENGTRKGRTAHYFLRPEDEMYLEQSTFTIGYYETLTRLWKKTAEAPMVQVRHVATRFSPEKLLADEYAYASEGLGIQEVKRNREGNLLIDGEIWATATALPGVMERWLLSKKYANNDTAPVIMERDLTYRDEIIFHKGQILDAPASVYEWEYQELPPINRCQIFIQGFRDRFASTAHLRESYQRVAEERDRAEELLVEAREQRALAEERAAMLENAAWAAGHLLGGAASNVIAELGQVVAGMEKAARTLGGMRNAAETGELERVLKNAEAIAEYFAKQGGPADQIQNAIFVCRQASTTFGPINSLFAGRHDELAGDTFTLAPELETLAGMYNHQARIKGVPAQFTVSAEGDSTLNNYDRGLVLAYVFNLLENAFWSVDQRTSTTGTADGRVEMCLRESEAGIELTVRDNGLGIGQKQFSAYLNATIASGKGAGSRKMGTQTGKYVADYYHLERTLENTQEGGLTIHTVFSKNAPA